MPWLYSDADSEILISTWKPGGRDQFKNIHLPFGNDLIRLKNPDTIEPIIAFFGSKFNVGGVFAFLYDCFSKPGLFFHAGVICQNWFCCQLALQGKTAGNRTHKRCGIIFGVGTSICCQRSFRTDFENAFRPFCHKPYRNGGFLGLIDNQRTVPDDFQASTPSESPHNKSGNMVFPN